MENCFKIFFLRRLFFLADTRNCSEKHNNRQEKIVNFFYWAPVNFRLEPESANEGRTRVGLVQHSGTVLVPQRREIPVKFAKGSAGLRVHAVGGAWSW